MTAARTGNACLNTTATQYVHRVFQNQPTDVSRICHILFLPAEVWASRTADVARTPQPPRLLAVCAFRLLLRFLLATFAFLFFVALLLATACGHTGQYRCTRVNLKNNFTTTKKTQKHQEQYTRRRQPVTPSVCALLDTAISRCGINQQGVRSSKSLALGFTRSPT